MVKKLFALASVTALAGVVSAVGAAGCTETVVQQSPSDAGGGGTTDAKPRDSGGGKPSTGTEEDAGDTEPKSCMVTDPIDSSKYEYKSPLKSPGSCTEKEAADLSAWFKEQYDANTDPILMSEWAKTVSATCAKCVFSDGSGTTWTPIVVDTDDTLGHVNRGGCIEIQSGKQACGDAYERLLKCRSEACTTKCKTNDEYSECMQDAQGLFGQGGPCEAAYNKMGTECGNNASAYETACQGKDWTFEGPIKFQCVTSVTKD